MPPSKKGKMPKKKKQKLSEPQQTVAEKAIAKLAAMSFNMLSAPPNLAADLISPLKPGLGLLGNAEEEEKFRAECWGESEEDPTEMKDDDMKDYKIGGVDFEEDGEDDNEEIFEGEQQDMQLQLYTHKEKKPKQNGQIEDEEIELGDYEKYEFGRDYLEIQGEHIHVAEYIGGDKYTRHIHAIYKVVAIETPLHMNLSPHYHQLQGAAQIDFCCRAQPRGCILADYMGLGKTLTAILAMWMVKDDPGYSLVVAPKMLCQQWFNEIHSSWEEGHGMKAYYLEDSNITAHELLALGVDIVVCSYDQVEACYRAMKNLPEELDKFSNDQTGTVKRPPRPNAVLHSAFWDSLGIRIKRLVLDECQVANKRVGVRHQAVRALPYNSVVMLSGSPAHNLWHDFSGYIDFLPSSHPFPTHARFMKAFASIDYEGKFGAPDLPRLRLLQRYLQGFTIGRPASILRLKDCIRHRVSFKLRQAHVETVDCFFKKYQLIMRISSQEPKASDEYSNGKGRGLAYAIRAQMASLHPLLEGVKEYSTDDFVDLEEEDPILGYMEVDQATKGGLERDEWLKKVRQDKKLCTESDRTLQFLNLYKQLRRTNPKQKMLVFSQYLRYLDIIAEALKRCFNVQALRYDGTVSQNRRLKVQEDFREADPSIPLLMTASAGAFGLNLATASIVIQLEVWWNQSVEWQAICRAWRQRQETEVIAIQLMASNSAIDCEIARVQKRKASTTTDLMEPLIRLPDSGPDLRPLLFAPVLPIPKFNERDNNS